MNETSSRRCSKTRDIQQFTLISSPIRKQHHKKQPASNDGILLLLCSGSGLLGCLGNLTRSFGLVNSLNNTYSNSLPHIANSEPSQWCILGEGFNAKWLGGNKFNNTGITRLEELKENSSVRRNWKKTRSDYGIWKPTQLSKLSRNLKFQKLELKFHLTQSLQCLEQ